MWKNLTRAAWKLNSSPLYQRQYGFPSISAVNLRKLHDHVISDLGDGNLRVTSSRMAELLQSEREAMSQLGQAGITIQQLIDLAHIPSSSGKLLMTAQFVHRELPVRYAVRSKEMELMEDWLKTSQFQRIQDIYNRAFEKLRMCKPIHSESDVPALESVVLDIQNQHSQVVPLMAASLHHLREEGMLLDPDRAEYLNLMMEKFFSARVSSELLVSQLLHQSRDHREQHNHTVTSGIGGLELSCNLADVCVDAISITTRLCKNMYGIAPEVRIRGNLDVSITYFPEELKFILVELISNAMRATVKHHSEFSKVKGSDLGRGGGDVEMPPVQVVISGGESLAGIMIQDEGGGIPLKQIPKFMDWSYTTQSKENQRNSLKRMMEFVEMSAPHEPVDKLPEQLPFTGLGFGIPLARLYAMHFGGQLKFRSLEGFGTTTFLHLNTDTSHSENIHNTRWHTRSDCYYVRCHNSGLVSAKARDSLVA